jgi:hypothetical protein
LSFGYEMAAETETLIETCTKSASEWHCSDTLRELGIHESRCLDSTLSSMERKETGGVRHMTRHARGRNIPREREESGRDECGKQVVGMHCRASANHTVLATAPSIPRIRKMAGMGRGTTKPEATDTGVAPAASPITLAGMLIATRFASGSFTTCSHALMIPSSSTRPLPCLLPPVCYHGLLDFEGLDEILPELHIHRDDRLIRF